MSISNSNSSSKQKENFVFMAATLTSKNSLIDYNSSDDDDNDEDIEELLRINGILHPPPAIIQSNNTEQRQQLQQYVVVTPKASSKIDNWNTHAVDYLHSHRSNNHDNLPSALLKLDQQHAIPTLRHCNDILVEIEACTIESRHCMTRSGMRCGNNNGKGGGIATTSTTTEDKKQLFMMEVETTSVDCIGRVVQLATTDNNNNQEPQSSRHHDIRINDRIAALYPFEYKIDKSSSSLSRHGNYHHQRYALVDAGYTVKLPTNKNDTTTLPASYAACITRIYTTAFQSLQLGITSSSPPPPSSLIMSSYHHLIHNNHHYHHQRYNIHQLDGKSILIQNGTSELGRAWIQLCNVLGATHVFSTVSSPEEYDLLQRNNREVNNNVIPIRWKNDSAWSGDNDDDDDNDEDDLILLLGQEKLNLILIQDFPSCDDFELFFSVLDDTCGSLVYCSRDDDSGRCSSGGGGGGEEDDDEKAKLFGELGNLASGGVGCNSGGSNILPSFQDLAKKAREVVALTKFSLRLTCSPQFVTYRGIWASCKEDQAVFQRDLSFLFKLLEAGKLKPHVEECISPEDIPSVQGRIELEGKKNRGTVVCLPAPLYEKKAAVNVVSPFNSPEDVSHHSSVSKWDEDIDGGQVDAVSYAENYAADSGYIFNHYKPSAETAAVVAATSDEDCNIDLSDFHSMNGLSGQLSLLRPRLPSNGSDSLLQIEHSPSFSTLTSVSSVSVKANEFLRDYNLLGRKF